MMDSYTLTFLGGMIAGAVIAAAIAGLALWAVIACKDNDND